MLILFATSGLCHDTPPNGPSYDEVSSTLA
jgi:hypothetical protein